MARAIVLDFHKFKKKCLLKEKETIDNIAQENGWAHTGKELRSLSNLHFST